VCERLRSRPTWLGWLISAGVASRSWAYFWALSKRVFDSTMALYAAAALWMMGRGSCWDAAVLVSTPEISFVARALPGRHMQTSSELGHLYFKLSAQSSPRASRIACFLVS
jgi:hypothetical protein